MHALAFQLIVALLGAREVNFDAVDRQARAVAAVVESESLPYVGRDAKRRTTRLLVALAYQESGLREEIEQCRWTPVKGMTQDDGRSVGLLQLYQGWSWRGHTRAEICGDAELQFRLALRYLTEQVRRCGSVELALTSYNRNQCAVSIYSSGVMRVYRRLERLPL